MNPRILFLLTLTLLLPSCDVVEKDTFRSYILDYYDYPEFVLETSDSGDILVAGLGEKKWLGGWDSKGREKVIYDSLCVLHNDMEYKTRRRYIAGPEWGDNFKGDILSINVVSDADFDEQHPAHSSLNDVIRLLSVSPYPYITSGYKNTFDWNNDPHTRSRYEDLFLPRGGGVYKEWFCYHPLDKKLSEVTSSDLILAESAFLTFEQPPTLAKEHKLTVTIRLSDGRVFSPTITKVFTPEPS